MVRHTSKEGIPRVLSWEFVEKSVRRYDNRKLGVHTVQIENGPLVACYKSYMTVLQ